MKALVHFLALQSAQLFDGWLVKDTALAPPSPALHIDATVCLCSVCHPLTAAVHAVMHVISADTSSRSNSV